MNFRGLAGGYGGEQVAMDCAKPTNALAKPRTLREQLTDQIAQHKARIADLEEACESLTPDVEKALNALQKL